MSSNIKSTCGSIKKINWGNVFAISFGILLFIGGWYFTRIDRQFDRIDRQFDRIETTLERIERDNRDFHGRLVSLEEKFEERKRNDN